MFKRIICFLLAAALLFCAGPLALAEGIAGDAADPQPTAESPMPRQEAAASPDPAASAPEPSLEPSLEPSAEPSGTPSSSPVPQATEAPSPSPLPEVTAPPDITPTPAAEATLSPLPSPTPEPASTPLPQITQSPAAEALTTATPGPAVLDACVTMGADLTPAQREAVYRDFGIAEGSVKELLVTNAEERAYLEDLIPDRKIGSVALSCIYIQRLEAGSGLTLKVQNINYCTEEMYKNALSTAGITDACVMVTAPFPVSGTGALTGAYKAYEDMTGTALNDLAKAVGAEELVLTGELSEYIGSEEAVQLIGELKTMLDQTQVMSDAEVLEEMDAIAAMYGISLTDGQKKQVLNLIRKLEGLETGELQSRLTDLAKTAQGAGRAAETVSKVYDSVKGFLASIGGFFSRIFG